MWNNIIWCYQGALLSLILYLKLSRYKSSDQRCKPGLYCYNSNALVYDVVHVTMYDECLNIRFRPSCVPPSGFHL
jgi:hypothetical protein